MIPWAQQDGNLLLVEWLARNHCDGAGKRALVVGCGLGDDAEVLATSPVINMLVRRRFTTRAL